MREVTYGEAVREALAEEMRRDKMVALIGEDVGALWRQLRYSQGTLGRIRGRAGAGHAHQRKWPLSVLALGQPSLGCAPSLS